MRKRLTTMAVASALCLITGLAAAATLNVAPVRVELASGASSATIQVHNMGADVAIMQATPVRWTQTPSDAQAYAPTQALIVTPAVFSVAPGQTQVLRLGLRNAAGGSADEQAYRLLLKEVPSNNGTDSSGGGTALRIALRISMPVFVLPDAAVMTASTWKATRLGPRQLQMTVSNTGNTHLQITQLNLEAGGKALGLAESAPALMYVLPGQSRSWNLPTQKTLPAAGQTIRIDAQTNHGARSEQLTLGS